MLNPVDYLYIAWLTYLPFSLKAFYHYIVDKDGFEAKPGPNPANTNPFIIFQYTTRGQHADVVAKGIESVNKACANNHHTSYRIDVITDGTTDNYDAKIIRVPDDFTTPNGTKKKARALEYAVQEHRQQGHYTSATWIWHMDEESIVTDQSVAAVLDYIGKGGKPVSEGPIVYSNKFMRKNILPSLVECCRPYQCYECMHMMTGNSVPTFIHGSNLLVRSDIEDAVGWDFGDSLTEDQRFGYEAHKKFGAVFGWHGGMVVEQPPLNVKDTFRQRRRWAAGSRQNLKFMPFKDRIYQSARLLSWAAGFVSGIVTFAIWIFQGSVPFILQPVFFMQNVLWVLGYEAGFRETYKWMDVSRVKKVILHALIIVILPIVSLMDCLPAFVGIITGKSGWKVTPK